MKFATWFKKNIFPIIIIIVGLVYTTRGLAEIDKTGKTVYEILANGFLATIFGYIIAVLWGELGIREEMSSDEFAKIADTKDAIVDKITPKIGLLHIWCDKKNDLFYQRETTRILRKVGVTYHDYEMKLYDQKDRLIKRTIKKVRNAYREIYSFDALLSNSDTDERGISKRYSISGYRAATNLKKILSSILSGVVFGYFTLNFADGLDWANVIWFALQVVMFNLMGFMQYIVNRSFILQTIGTQMKNDTNALWEFDNDTIQHPEKYAITITAPITPLKIDEIKKAVSLPVETVKEETIKKEAQP